MTDQQSDAKTKKPATKTRLPEQADKQPAQPENELPAGIGAPATRVLLAVGYTRLDQLAKARVQDLLKLHGMGPKAIGIIREALKAKGMHFSGE